MILLIPAICAWIITYTPPETVPGFPGYRIHVGLAMDLTFVCSLFVLGGDFWDKVRALFMHKAKARFSEPGVA